MAGVLGYAGLGVAIFALISVIVSVALDYWMYYSVGENKSYSGLWKTCDEGPSDKVCTTFTDASTELNAVRAMVILALVLDVGAIVCGALKLFVMKDKKVLGHAATGLLAAAGLFLIVGFAVYVAKIFDPSKSLNPEITLHAGFAFCIIAWLASWTAAGLFGVATVQDKD